MSPKNRIYLVFLIFLLVCGTAYSFDEGNQGGAFSTIGIGASGISMGTAFTSVVSDGSAPYWNPAGISFMENKAVFMSYQNTFSLSSLHQGYFAYSTPEENMGSGSIFGYYSHVDDLYKNEFEKWDGWNEMIFGYNYAKRLSRDFAFGFNLKYLYIRTDVHKDGETQDNFHGFGSDLGFLYRHGDLSVGMSIKDVYAYVKYNDETEHFPIEMSLGTSYTLYDRILLTADVRGGEENAVSKVAGGAKVSLYRDVLRLSAGALYHLPEESRIVITGGIGFSLQRYLIDYAFIFDQDGPGNTHQVSIQIDF